MALTIVSPAAALAAALIADEEGFRAVAYFDSAGSVWSIGFGFCTLLDGSPVTARTPPLSLVDCNRMLAAKLLAEYMPGVVRDIGVPMTDGQLAALSSFAWNEGIGRLGASSIPRLAKAGAWSGVAAAMRQYVYAGGRILPDLVGRRKREAAVLLGATFIPGKRTGAPLGTLSAPPVQQQLHAASSTGRTVPGARPVPVVSAAQSAGPQPEADALMAEYDRGS